MPQDDMDRLNVFLHADLSKKLRLRAVELYGGEKGALSKALADALEEWLKQPSSKKNFKTASNRMKEGFHAKQVRKKSPRKIRAGLENRESHQQPSGPSADA